MLILSSLIMMATAMPANDVANLSLSAQQRPLVGGYRIVDVSDELVVTAAAFAAQSVDGELGEVTSAERQTVAGANYRLSFTTSDGRSYRAEVYQGLDRSYTVRSIEEVGDHHGAADEPAEESGESDE